MLCDSVFEQDHINVVVKVLFLLTRWFLPFQFAGQQTRTRSRRRLLRKSRISTWCSLTMSTDMDRRIALDESWTNQPQRRLHAIQAVLTIS